MKVKEIIKFLVEAEDYVLARLTVDDSTVEMIRDHMDSHYDLIKEKEEGYLELVELLSNYKNPTELVERLSNIKDAHKN